MSEPEIDDLRLSPFVVNDPARLEIRYDLQPWDKVALGLDLGTRTGYAYAILRPDRSWLFHPYFIGVWDLSTGRYDTGNLGFLRLRCFLEQVKPVAVFYEEIKNTPAEAVTKYNAARLLARAATAAELLGAFKQTLCLWCEDHGAHCTGTPIGTIKRRATGKGNANKQMMVEACNQEFHTNFDVETCEQTGADDAADAAWILRVGLEEYGNGL